MKINKTFCGRRLRSMLFTASISVCAEIINVLVDKIVAAQCLGEKALASISFFTPLYSTVLFVSSVIMVGSLVCYSIEIGKMNKERADRFFGQSIILSVISGVLLTFSFAFIKKFLLDHAGLDADLFHYVDEFYVWFLGLAFLLPINNVLQEMVYVDGDTRTCNISYGVLIGCNVVLSFLFCRSLGIAGIAFGTLVSVFLSILTLCTHFLRKTNTLKFVWHVNIRDVGFVVRYSLAESCEFLLFALFTSIVNFFFIRSIGFDYLPVLSMVYEIVELSVVFNGAWMAAEPLINTYRGEKNDKGIIRTMLYLTWTVSKEALLATIILFIFAPYVVSIFHIHSAELNTSAVFAVRVCSVGFLPLAFSKILACYHVHEKPQLSFMFIALAIFVMPLVCIISAGTLFGEKAFWLGFGVSSFMAFVLGCSLQLLLYGKKKFPLLLEHYDEMSNWRISDMKLTPGNLLRFRDRMDRLMTNRQVNVKTRLKVMLLIEELGMVTYQRNKNRDVYVEYSVVMQPDSLMLICKDDGKNLDMTDLEQSITDLRMYLINMFMSVQQDKRYLLTANYNRYAFKFER